MKKTTEEAVIPTRIESLEVQNFRTLRHVGFKNLTPLTVLVGPNGSGKSTALDVFAFLSECFEQGLRQAWGKRGRAKELKTRGGEGPVSIEIKYRERPNQPVITYHLAIEEEANRPVVMEEWLQWRRGAKSKPFRFLDYHRGEGRAISGEQPDEKDDRISIPLNAPDLLAVNVLGQFAEYQRVAALRTFIMGWCVPAESARGLPEAGNNLANIIQYLAEQHPDRLNEIFNVLRRWVPRVERVLAETMPNGRLSLQIKDSPFSHPVLAKFASDGTLKMLACLVMLYDPAPPPFIGVEEPENFLHPRLLPELAEEYRKATERTQLLITTHSPFFLNALKPEEVRVLWRDSMGYTQAMQLSELPAVRVSFQEKGGLLGHLWVEGQLGVGDPLVDRDGLSRFQVGG